MVASTSSGDSGGLRSLGGEVIERVVYHLEQGLTNVSTSGYVLSERNRENENEEACRVSEASEAFEHPQGPPGTLRTPHRGHHTV